MALPEERLTEDLLGRLLAAETPEAYLDEADTLGRDLVDYLRELLADRGLNRSKLCSGRASTPPLYATSFRARACPVATTPSCSRLGSRAA